MRRLYFSFLAIFLLPIHILSSQELGNTLVFLKSAIPNAKLSIQTKEKLKKKVNSFEILMNECNSVSQNFYKKTVKSPCQERLNLEFKYALINMLSLKDFTKVFKQSFEGMVDLEVNYLYNVIKEPFDFSPSQTKKIKKKIKEEVEKQLLLAEYLDFNSKIKEANIDVLKQKAQYVYLKTLEAFNFKKTIVLNTDIHIKSWIKRAEKSNIPIKKINAVSLLLIEKKIELAQLQLDLLNADREYSFYDQKKKNIELNFKKKIAQIVTLNEFEVFFKVFLSNKINILSNEKLEQLISENNISPSDFLKYKELTAYYAKEQIILQEYYLKDKNIAFQKITSSKISEQKAYNDVAKSLEGVKTKSPIKTIDTSADKRILKFIDRAKKVGIEPHIINKLVIAIKKQKQEEKDYHKNFKIWRKDHIIFFPDSKSTPNGTRLRLRKKINKLLTLEQFSNLFQDQFLPRVEREVKERMDEVHHIYTDFTDEQYKELSEMITEQVIKERNIYEYYGYDHLYAMRKLKGTRYQFEKKYKSYLNNNKVNK